MSDGQKVATLLLALTILGLSLDFLFGKKAIAWELIIISSFIISGVLLDINKDN